MQYCGASARGGKHDGRGRPIDHAPFAEAHETRGEMLRESLHQMAVILVDAMHRKGPQHQACLGGCIGAMATSERPVWRPVPLIILHGEFVIRCRSAAIGRRALESAELDVRNEFFGRRRRLHAVVAVQQIPQRLVDAQRAGDIAFFGMRPHQMAAGLFVGRIEIDDGGRDPLFGVGGNVARPSNRRRDFASAVHGWSDAWPAPRPGTTDRDRPCLRAAARRAAGYRAAADGRARFRPAGCTLSMSTSTLPDVDADHQPLGDEAVISGILEHRPQFANDLAQRGARLFLVRPAPQQADQPLAALLLRLRQREIAENRAGLAGSQFDQPAVEPHAEAPDQRDRQTRSAFGRRRGVVCCDGVCTLAGMQRFPEPVG